MLSLSVSLGAKVLVCAISSILIVKLASDQQRGRWHAKQEGLGDFRCPDVLLGPEERLDWANWLPYAKTLSQEVAAADEEEGFDVIFYGDSITEQWRGSGVGSVYPSLQDTKKNFDARFNANYSSHVLAIAGDQAGHLWWRMLNGQLPSKKHPKAVVMLIGTNDLTADDCTEEEAASVVAAGALVNRVSEILSVLREGLPQTDIVLLGLLPRDAHVLSGPPAWEWPNRMTSAIAYTNTEYQRLAETDEHIHFVSGGDQFLNSTLGLEKELLPDALHPNTPGMDLLASCIQPHIDEIMKPVLLQDQALEVLEETLISSPDPDDP